ncbi:DNA repair protein endonuclease SAE2/CtIP C-terminus-domain-containing protein [Mycena crocata]|nr:DNA repair protein endonuclease SAE2/CtIP C-terminus-domain-containing protein [Mycena crocata]
MQSGADADRQEIARLERELDNAKDTVHQQNVRISDLEKKLAETLGFETVSAAEAFIKIDEPIPYKELTVELSRERAENERLRAQVQELLMDRDTLRAKIDSSALLNIRNATPSRSAEKQLQALQHRYDELRAVKQRAEDKYKAQYRKFAAHKTCLGNIEIQELEDQLHHDLPKLTKDERRRRREELTTIKLQKIEEFIAADQDDAPSPASQVNKQRVEDFASDKENQQTPAATRKRYLSLSPAISTGSPIIGAKFVQPALDVAPSPLYPHSTSFQSINTAKQLLAPSAPAGIILVPDSSDTEADPSQGMAFLKISPIPTEPMADSSETEDDSQDPYSYLTKAPPVPVPAQVRTQVDSEPSAMTSTSRLGGQSPFPQPIRQRSKSKTRHSEGSASFAAARTDISDERPRKMRRVSSPGLGSGSARRASGGEPGASATSPFYVESGHTPRKGCEREANASTSKKAKGVVKDGKGKQRELTVKMESSTPVTDARTKQIRRLTDKMEITTPVANARASSSKQLADYSAFKGRGRYAKDGADGNTTINANFEIDPAQNGGRDYQFDDVVRGQEDRRHMEAGDCECCRDYYAAIGPMPNRLQAPLWRTPPSSPSGSKPCLRTGSERTENADITSHKQAISRHRHHWARPKTPPSYWSIGFPNTQEVAGINEKAREMHQAKEKYVQEEAARDGGRYKKR